MAKVSKLHEALDKECARIDALNDFTVYKPSTNWGGSDISKKQEQSDIAYRKLQKDLFNAIRKALSDNKDNIEKMVRELYD